jgi:hypothetical protein
MKHVIDSERRRLPIKLEEFETSPISGRAK